MLSSAACAFSRDVASLIATLSLVLISEAYPPA